MIERTLELPNCFYRISVKGVIKRDGKLLLVREHHNFSLPGGGLDHGEALGDGLARELREEISFDSDVRPAPMPSYIGFGSGVREDAPFKLTQFCFLCFPVDVAGDVLPGPLAKEIRWFSKEDVEAARNEIGADELSSIRKLVN